MIKKIKHLKGVESLTKDLVKQDFLNPKKVFVQVDTPRCKKATLSVAVGDQVLAQQIIGVRDCKFYQENIISPVSGTVVNIEKRFTSMGKIADAVVIENDFKQSYDKRVKMISDDEVFSMSKEKIMERITENSVVGMGGAGFPTSIKLQPKTEISHLLVNGVECEPGTKADFCCMIDSSCEAIKGAKLAAKVVGAKNISIAVKKTKIEAIEAMKACIAKHFPNDPIQILEVEDYYPQGWEVELIRKTMKVDIQGQLPACAGIIQLNVTTCKAIFLACANNMAIDTVDMVVSGEVNKPSLIKTRVGVEVSELLALAGGYKSDDRNIMVLGGPMMGSCILLENAITYITNSSLLVFKDETIIEENCVRCSSCVKSCPAGLAPVQIMELVKANDKAGLKNMNVKDCVECGLCTYVCTSQIHVTEFIRKAKKIIG